MNNGGNTSASANVRVTDVEVEAWETEASLGRMLGFSSSSALH